MDPKNKKDQLDPENLAQFEKIKNSNPTRPKDTVIKFDQTDQSKMSHFLKSICGCGIFLIMCVLAHGQITNPSPHRKVIQNNWRSVYAETNSNQIDPVAPFEFNIFKSLTNSLIFTNGLSATVESNKLIIANTSTNGGTISGDIDLSFTNLINGAIATNTLQDSSISILQNSNSTQQLEIQNLEGDVSAINSSISILNSSNTTQQVEIQNLEGDVTSINSSISILNSSNTTQQVEIQKVTSDINTINSYTFGLYLPTTGGTLSGNLQIDGGYLQLGSSAGVYRKFKYDGSISSDGSTWSTIWNSGNDGAGSGLDSDLLDNLNSTQFVKTDSTGNVIKINNVSGHPRLSIDSENFKLFTDQNDGAGSGLIPDTVGGLDIVSSDQSTTVKLKVDANVVASTVLHLPTSFDAAAGNRLICTSVSDNDVYVNFDNLKQKIITGTTSSDAGGSSYVSHGLDSTRIVCVVYSVRYTDGSSVGTVPPGVFNTGYFYESTVNSNYVVFINGPTGTSAQILSKTWYAIIFYI